MAILGDDWSKFFGAASVHPPDLRRTIDVLLRPKVVVLCGSSRFVDVMAVCAWLIERDEHAITMGLHLLPSWYPNCPADHLAEHEGVREEMDELHKCKIDLCDEIFVVNLGGYVGSSTQSEIEYCGLLGKPIRYFHGDPIGNRVAAMNGPQGRGKLGLPWMDFSDRRPNHPYTPER